MAFLFLDRSSSEMRVNFTAVRQGLTFRRRLPFRHGNRLFAEGEAALGYVTVRYGWHTELAHSGRYGHCWYGCCGADPEIADLERSQRNSRSEQPRPELWRREVGVDRDAMLLEPEPHIPDNPDVSSIPTVDIPDVADIPTTSIFPAVAVPIVIPPPS